MSHLCQLCPHLLAYFPSHWLSWQNARSEVRCRWCPLFPHQMLVPCLFACWSLCQRYRTWSVDKGTHLNGLYVVKYLLNFNNSNNPKWAHVEEILFLPVDRFVGRHHPSVIIDGEHPQWLLSHTHPTYIELVSCVRQHYLVIKHLVKRHQDITCYCSHAAQGQRVQHLYWADAFTDNSSIIQGRLHLCSYFRKWSGVFLLYFNCRQNPPSFRTQQNLLLEPL